MAPVSDISIAELNNIESVYDVKLKNMEEGLNIFGFPENVEQAESFIRASTWDREFTLKDKYAHKKKKVRERT